MDGRRSPPDGATTESGVQADSSAAIKCAGAVRVGRNARSKNKTGSWADADLAGTVVHFDRDVALSGLSPLWCRSGIFPALVILHKVPFSVSNYRPVTLYERFCSVSPITPDLAAAYNEYSHLPRGEASPKASIVDLSIVWSSPATTCRTPEHGCPSSLMLV